jgi:hypothetical protein
VLEDDAILDDMAALPAETVIPARQRWTGSLDRAGRHHRLVADDGIVAAGKQVGGVDDAIADMEDDAILDDMAALPAETVIPARQRWTGSPAAFDRRPAAARRAYSHSRSSPNPSRSARSGPARSAGWRSSAA